MDGARPAAANVWGRHGVTIAWAATALLTLPAMRTTFALDDFLQRLVLDGKAPELRLGPTSLYDFTGGGLPLTTWLERGYVPWFTDPNLAIRFFRPLSSLSIALDHALFGNAPLPSHLTGAALFVAFTAVAFALFRRTLSPNRAGLAAVLFALAGGHNVNLAWVAGRHVLVGGLFGALAVFAHVRRRENPTPNLLLGPAAALALLVSMLASETALAAAALIVCFELFGTDAAPRRRMLRAAPWLGAALLYVAIYSAAGYGVRHSSLYISPVSSPGAFVRAALTRWPILIGELSFALPAAVWSAVMHARAAFALFGAVTATLVVALAWRATESELERRRVKWFATSVLFATLPVVGGVPDGRVLLVPMLASMPLVALALDYALNAAVDAWRLPLRAAGGALFFMHAVFAPVARLGTTELMTTIAKKQRALAESADFSSCATGSPLFVVTGADPSLCLSGGTSLRYYRDDLARQHPSLTVLSLSPHDLELERTSERELVLSVDDEPKRHTIFERLFRDTPLRVGQSVSFERFAAHVLATEHGLFTRVAFELPPDACLVTLEHGRMLGHPQPPVGTRLHVPHEPGPLGL